MSALPRIDLPQPGFFRTKMVKHGPFVPARIWIDTSISDRPAMMLAEINGQDVPPDELWPRVAGRGAEITESEWLYLEATRKHAEQYEPQSAEANPRRAFDLRTVPMPF